MCLYVPWNEPTYREALCLPFPCTGYFCQCPALYGGRRCNVLACNSSSCVHGACHTGLLSQLCDCNPGYSGVSCDQDINECQSSPCVHGSCKDGVNSFKCVCLPGYTGSRCELDNDECQELVRPCYYGQCENIPGSYRCDCPSGLTGAKCETDIQDCPASVCAKNVTCNDGLEFCAIQQSPGML